MNRKEEIKSILIFLKEIERMKNVTRTAWTTKGKQESVAEHSWRLTVFAFLLEDYFPDANFSKIIKMCLIHDLGEAISGDISAYLQVDPKIKEEQELNGINQILLPLPQSIKAKFYSLWEEYNEGRTLEAKIAKAIDKIETIVQHNQGKNPSDFNYEFNLIYGKDYTQFDDFIKAIREIVDNETLSRVENVKNSKSQNNNK
jgi:putative hydrolases of HD superfamily